MEPIRTDIYERLMNAALRFISYRLRSKKELRDFLNQKLVKSSTSAPDTVRQVIIRLEELGYINDERFCQWWVNQRRGTKPKGMRMIRAELQDKGISPMLIDSIVGQSRDDERVLAKLAAVKKASLWRSLPVSTQKKKITDFLIRRGFSSEVAWSIVDDVVENV